MKKDKMENFEFKAHPLHGFWALTNRELKKWYKEPILILLSLIQPIAWLGLFGKAMNLGGIFNEQAFDIPGLNLPKQLINQIANQAMLNAFGTSDYFSFLAVGMMAFVTVFTSISSGISLVWDRRLGFLDKLLSTPVARGAVLMSKALNGVVRALVQSGIALAIAILLGMDISKISAIGILMSFAALFLLGLGLGSIFIMVAVRSTSWQTQMAIMNLLNLPLIFTSNALFPTKFMPSWLQSIAHVNPVTYAIDICRQALVGSEGITSIGFDFAVLSLYTIIFTFIGILVSWKALSQ